MHKVLGIGGFFFRARNPQALSAWYTTHLGIDIAEAVWQQESGPTVFSPFQHDTAYFGRPEQEWMLNFRVADLDGFIAQLRSSGIAAETRPQEWDSEVGRFARIHDPEGNPIELWEPAPHPALDSGSMATGRGPHTATDAEPDDGGVMKTQRWGSGARGRNHTVAHGDTVWLVSNARNVQAGFREQAMETLTRLQSFLVQAGSDKSQLLSVQVVLADIADRDDFDEIWCAWTGPDPDHWPQRAVFGASLAPGLLVEIIATAARSRPLPRVA